MTATMSRTAYAPLAAPRATPLVAARAAAPAPGRLRLTRRGRLVLTVLAAALLFLAISIGRTGSQAALVTETGAGYQQATVQPGDTLWSVAQRIAPDNDPREVIDQIRRINDLQGSSLRVGQQLLLPTATR